MILLTLIPLLPILALSATLAIAEGRKTHLKNESE